MLISLDHVQPAKACVLYNVLAQHANNLMQCVHQWLCEGQNYDVCIVCSLQVCASRCAEPVSALSR
jgi:hypothetical protein